MNPKTPWRNAPLLPEASAAAGLAVFAGLFAALLLSHWTLLRLPYYWDEAGYYIPAAWDFFRTGSLIPISTLTNAHPPLPSVYLALAWKLFGFSPLTTRVATLAVAALGLTAVWRLALQLTGSRAIAAWTLLLTALYPIWFAQSSLAHADIYAAACTLWGLVYALPSRGKKLWAAALCFAAAALAKETSIAVPLALAAIFWLRGSSPAFRHNTGRADSTTEKLLLRLRWRQSVSPTPLRMTNLLKRPAFFRMMAD